jgi:very-short-patch-repair endonuclease
LDNAWNLRLLSGRSLLALLDEYGKRGRDGTAVLRELVEARGMDYTPPASNLESRVQDLLGRVGLDLRRQVDSGGDDWSGRVDFRDHVLPLILEVQSERYHSALLDVEADERRRDQLRADGFEVVEVTDVEVWADGDLVVERVRRARRRLLARRAS